MFFDDISKMQLVSTPYPASYLKLVLLLKSNRTKLLRAASLEFMTSIMMSLRFALFSENFQEAMISTFASCLTGISFIAVLNCITKRKQNRTKKQLKFQS